ncbi:hypothetical protein ACP70R_049377 [Stipagrostis hirtigluma subsp. patula]
MLQNTNAKIRVTNYHRRATMWKMLAPLLIDEDHIAPSLKSLHLSYDDDGSNDASYEVLNVAIKKLPLLEDLEISPLYLHISASDRLFESVCKARPLLKNLKIRFTLPSDYDFAEVVLEECQDGDIYRTPMMCELRSLELSNYILTGEQLTAILDNCPLLESLHITGFFVDRGMDAKLRAKCARVKNLTLPDGLTKETNEDSGEEDN